MALMLSGFLVRAGLALWDHEQYILPWSGADSARFFREAVAFSREYYLTSLLNPPFDSSDMYPWVLSWFGRAFGCDYLFLVFLNVLLGTFNIIQAHWIGRRFFSDRRQIYFAIFIACFPVSLVLSATLIRETVIATFMLFAFYYMLRVAERSSLANILRSALSLLGASLFHGALVFSLVVFPVSYYVAYRLSNRRRFQRPERLSTILFGFTSIFAVLVVVGAQFSKVGELDSVADRIERRMEIEGRRSAAVGSDYPVFLSMNIIRPDIAFLRYCYFMFAPFPWDWRGVADVVATGFSVANLLAFFLFWRNRKNLRMETSFLFFVVLFTTLAFSVGVNNVGTAIRHRNKVLPALALVFLDAYPFVRRQ